MHGTRTTLLLAAACCFTTAGCEIAMDLPPAFVAVDERGSGYGLRGISSDGVVLGCRTEPNGRNGTVAFWTRAIENNVTGRGYALADSSDVTTEEGDAGTLMTFRLKSEGTTFGYWVLVLVRGKSVLIAEAGGRLESMAAREEEILASMKSVRGPAAGLGG